MKEFTFKTRFELGDKVSYLDFDDKKVHEGKIIKIHFNVTNRGTELWYQLEGDAFVSDASAYASKEELIAQL